PVHLSHLGLQTVDHVGTLYEYLRGFRLKIGPGNDLSAEPCSRSKRNHGVFYTPPSVVAAIVERTLDALQISDPRDYSELRILDPSMGTGAFLLEALDRIAGRVSADPSLWAGDVSAAPGPGMHDNQGLVMAVKAQLVEHCLFGIDVDPIAASIAEAALMERGGGAGPGRSRLRPRVFVGNSLMGDVRLGSGACSKEQEDLRHARAYFGKADLNEADVEQWARDQRVFHWHRMLPEVFSAAASGFDAIIGNPPYEVLSVKESGMPERSAEQRYFQSVYGTCIGKINTYRLMMERSLDLLKPSGVFGFIVPSTLLGDVAASKLRRRILDECEVRDMIVIPEKGRIFDGVTQALLIIVALKGSKTRRLEPISWDGRGEVPRTGGVGISIKTVEATGYRVPLLKTRNETELLSAVSRFPPLSWAGNGRAAAVVHQGEINITVHRDIITSEPTGRPLIRGEHVMPFRVVHPSSRPGRLDWVITESPATEKPREFQLDFGFDTGDRDRDDRLRGEPWKNSRLVVGRVVNMGTQRRLKAALVPPGRHLGDMTNSIVGITVPVSYLLGLLNSRLLNWRFKLTSTNNYVSAAEIRALPVPRPGECYPADFAETLTNALQDMAHGPFVSVAEAVDILKREMGAGLLSRRLAVLPAMIAYTTDRILAEIGAGAGKPPLGLERLLEALVLLAYGAEDYADIVEG
ncbi:MAG: N-6 DNA methylase, partial [Pseudomonadota bacterium]